MNIQKATKWFGIVTLIIGIIGFLWATVLPSGYFLGVFTINTIYGLVYIIAGLIALFSADSLGASILFLKIIGVLFLAIAICEVIGHSVFLGLFPVSIGDIILHIVLAVFALYVGFFAARAPAVSPAM